MENWNSDWMNCPEDNSDPKYVVSELSASCVRDDTIEEHPKSIDLFKRDTFPNSPTFSMDSSENLDDELHSKIEYPLLKTSIINASLAKKRLQAYSKQVRKSPVKEEKNDDNKNQKEPVKKPKKDPYPDEKAKAVIQEIEEIKRRDQEIEEIKKREFEDLCRRLATSDGFKPHLSRQISDSPDRSQQFKRREIKQRNYRRTDSISRESPTPEDVKSKDSYFPAHKYPRDWAEYKKQNLSIPKDSRGRYFQQKGFTLSFLQKIYNFDVPSPSVVPCRIATENGIKETPLHSLKVTQSRPSVIYSINTDKFKESFPTRNQLYDLVSKERQKYIKDVINKHSKQLPAVKKNTSRPWYNKQWRKSSFTECKVLEKSVGLSFLQNYSDEEDDIEAEEIIICSTTKKNQIETPVIGNFEYECLRTNARSPSESFSDKKTENDKPKRNSVSKASSDSKSEVSVFTPERSKLETVTVTNSALEDESGILTPDISALQLLQLQKNNGKSEERTNDKDAKSDLKKKKKKRKLENEQSDDDSPKKKKKRKSKRNKSSSSEDDDDSYDENKKKKKQKKLKTKEKGTKKKNLKADTTDDRLKKKETRLKKKRKLTPSEDVKKKQKKKIKKQGETSKKKSSNKKESAPEKTLKQKKVGSESSDSDSPRNKTQKAKEQRKNDQTEKTKQKKIKKEEALKETSKKHEPTIDVFIKKEPEDEPIVEVVTNNDNKTPDTNEYSGNWEKEDQFWEIEDENVSKEKLKLNLSSCWESDEELYENRLPESRPIEKPINTNEIRDLEIPLNIKPFKKREIQIINKDDFNLEGPPKDEKLEYLITENFQINVAKDAEKKRRWDRKESEPKTEETICENSAINTTETISAVLENEYEEFMKAVSSNTNSSPALEKLNASITSITTIDSKICLEITPKEQTKNPSQIVISPNDIPFIPMPEELKLQPVPSPSVVNIPKLSLSPKIVTTEIDVVTTTPTQVTDKAKSFSLMLPTKKLLIDNSNLKLGDSDDEIATVLKPIEDVKKEQSDTQQMQPVIESAKETNLEIEQSIDNSDLQSAKVTVYSIPRINDQPVDKSLTKVKARRKDNQPSKHRRESPRRKPHSPPREYSPRRRRKSPERYKSRSPSNRRYHSRRNYSPHRRRSPSPRRRSPKRSSSPRDRVNRRISSRSDDKKEKVITETKSVLSSPLEGPKRSVADSTISDDSLLPQPNLEEYTQSPVSYYMGSMKLDGRKRLTLDERINLELGYHKDDFKPISTTYDNFCHNRFTDNTQIESCTMDKNVFNENITSNFVQLGNMVEIVPTDLNLKTVTQPENKPRILQVGNVLQIVPTELPPEPPPPLPSVSPVAPPTHEALTNVVVTQEKQSAELNLKQKIDERKAEREKRKHEREAKRKEKEIRRREKEKRRQIKIKEKTENMIKKALQLEVESQNEEGNTDLPSQWPPIHISGTPKEIINKRSILLKYGRRSSKSRKKVQFADGVRPGEGTSPSAGEELTSPPPPSKVLPKEKRYTKTKLGSKSSKKKVKVKIIKPGETLFDDSDEDDNLPPPSPPPGSPPPHVFPPRIKPQIVTNHGYVPNVINQSPSVYRPSVNMLMMQPPLPDSPMQIHSYAQYQVPPLPPSAPSLPPAGTESASVPVHRNHYNYPL